MAAKDYTFAAGWKDIYLTKKTKPRKDGLHVMYYDRNGYNTRNKYVFIEKGGEL